MTGVLLNYIYHNVKLCMAPDFIGYMFPVLGKAKYVVILDIANTTWSVNKLDRKGELKNTTAAQYKHITKYMCKLKWIEPILHEEPFEEFSEKIHINPNNIVILPYPDVDKEMEYSCKLPPDDSIIDLENIKI